MMCVSARHMVHTELTCTLLSSNPTAEKADTNTCYDQEDPFGFL